MYEERHRPTYLSWNHLIISGDYAAFVVPKYWRHCFSRSSVSLFRPKWRIPFLDGCVYRSDVSDTEWLHPPGPDALRWASTLDTDWNIGISMTCRCDFQWSVRWWTSVDTTSTKCPETYVIYDPIFDFLFVPLMEIRRDQCCMDDTMSRRRRDSNSFRQQYVVINSNTKSVIDGKSDSNMFTVRTSLTITGNALMSARAERGRRWAPVRDDFWKWCISEDSNFVTDTTLRPCATSSSSSRLRCRCALTTSIRRVFPKKTSCSEIAHRDISTQLSVFVKRVLLKQSDTSADSAQHMIDFDTDSRSLTQFSAPWYLFFFSRCRCRIPSQLSSRSASRHYGTGAFSFTSLICTRFFVEKVNTWQTDSSSSWHSEDTQQGDKTRFHDSLMMYKQTYDKQKAASTWDRFLTRAVQFLCDCGIVRSHHCDRVIWRIKMMRIRSGSCIAATSLKRNTMLKVSGFVQNPVIPNKFVRNC